MRVLRRGAALRSPRGSPSPCTSARWSSRCRRRCSTYGPENLGPGDVLVTNDPHPSGVHLNDVSLISPVHREGELLGYVANLAHHVDVGGGAPASIGAFREVFQEGVIIPPVKLVDGRPDRRRRVPAHPGADPLEAARPAGDFRAQIAANATGMRRLQSLVDRHGLATVARDDGRAARVHRAADAGGARGAPARRLRGRGVGRHRRLHGRAGAAAAPGSRSAPTACGSTRPAPTRSGARP